jgi:hypothetical protein
MSSVLDLNTPREIPARTLRESVCRPEQHILLFRRALGTDPVSGKIDPVAAEAARLAYLREYGLEERK